MTANRHDDTMRRIARGGSANLVGSAMSALLALLLTWLVAQGVDPTQAGVYFALTSLFVVLVGVSEFGSDVSMSRFVPHFLVQARRRDARHSVRVGVTLSAVIGSALGLALIVFAAPVAELVVGEGPPDAAVVAMKVMGIALPFAALANLFLSSTRGMYAMVPTVVVDRIGRGAAQVLLAALVISLGHGSLLVEAWTVPYALAIIPAVIWFLSLARQHLAPHEGDLPALPARELRRRYVSFTWPRALTRFLQILLQRADVVLIAILRSPAEAAVYAIATRVIVLGQFAGSSLQEVLAPQLSRLLGRRESATATRVVQTTTNWSIVVTWPLYLLCISTPLVFLEILGGEGYRSGAAALMILAASMLVATASGPADTVLLMVGRSRLSLMNSAIAVLIDLACILLLVPTMGIEGAAVGWGVAIMTRSTLGAVQVRFITGHFPFARSALIAIGSVLLPFLVIPLLIGSRELALSWWTLGLLLLATTMYVILLHRFRGVLQLHALRAILPTIGSRRSQVPATPGGESSESDSGAAAQRSSSDPEAATDWESSAAPSRRNQHGE